VDQQRSFIPNKWAYLTRQVEPIQSESKEIGGKVGIQRDRRKNKMVKVTQKGSFFNDKN
jgi:hypothetical protein